MNGRMDGRINGVVDGCFLFCSSFYRSAFAQRSFVVAVVVLFDVIGEIMEWFEEIDE